MLGQTFESVHHYCHVNDFPFFRGQYKNISSHLDSIQLAMATAETLRSPRMHHYDEMISLEKGLIQSLSDPDALSVLSQLLHIVWKKDSKEYK